MNVSAFPLGPLQANCYILADPDTQTCAVTDPGGNGAGVAQWLRQQGLTPKFVLLTHGHFDHVGGVKELVGEFPGLPVYLHPEDRTLSPEMSQGLYWTDLYEDGDTLELGKYTIQVIHTPGHTPGSVCLRTENLLLSGDTLFCEGCGRTDFPGGSWSQMMDSLARLGALPGNPDVLPGHGPSSTLAHERQCNSYMKEAMKR